MRALTLNFWGNQAPLQTRLDLAVTQLRKLDPDVIALQEVRPENGRDGQTTADVLGRELAMNLVYKQALSWADDVLFPGYPAGEEGLAILAKAPIAEHRMTRLPEARVTEARILLSARVQAAGGDFWFHTTHLHYRLDDGLARERQVVAIDRAIRQIESERPHVLCGDFNASPDSDEIRYMRGLTTLEGGRTHWQDAWLRCHPEKPGFTWSSDNQLTMPLRSLDINRRIDYIFVSTRKKDGRGTIVNAKMVLDERAPSGLCASDHYGVMAEVELYPRS